MLKFQPRIIAAFFVMATLAITAMPNAFAESIEPRDGLNATLWKQNSVEYRANTLALYQLAKIRLDQALSDPTASAMDQVNAEDLPPAIIMDVDDTILDSGTYQGWRIQTNKPFTQESWNEWKQEKSATPVPGSLEFSRYAASKGVAIFYVTNREFKEKESTLANMRSLGYPLSDTEDRLLMRNQKPDWTQNKTIRRHHVAKSHRVLLLIGDHWGDVSDVSEGTEVDRHKALEENIAHIGKDWLILSNPEYGLFLSAPFDDDFSLSPDQQRQKKLDALDAWPGPSGNP